MSKPSSTNEQGVAMVEFAIILPLLLMIFLGVAEFGRALLFKHRLSSAVESGARYAARATGAVNTSDCSASATSKWTDMVAATQQLVTYGGMAAVPPPLVPGLDEGDVTVTVSPRTVAELVALGETRPVCVITVGVTVPYPGIFGAELIPLLNIAQPQLGATSEERYVGE